MANDEEPLLYEPDSSSSRHHINARKRSKRLTWRCCLIASTILGAILGSVGLFYIGHVLYTIASYAISPHLPLVYQLQPNITDDRLVVKPLLNASSRFDVLATVWLDITQHAQRGHKLPESIPVFSYTQNHSGIEFREAVIYSGTLFKNASMDSGMLHSSTQLKIPVEPFYTQALGPATLRATFRIVPHSMPDGLLFKEAISIYPDYLPIGPRSPASRKLNSTGSHQRVHFDRLVDEAMEVSAININLVSILPSQYQKSDVNMTLRTDGGFVSAMYDGSPSNRRFLNTTGRLADALGRQDEETPLYISRDHRVWVPQLRTRSRIMLLREDRTFDKVKYLSESLGQLNALNDACKEFGYLTANTSSSFISRGDCQRPIRGSVHENYLEFVDENERKSKNGSKVYNFYAPFLAQQASSAFSRHHRTIPRHSPLRPSPFGKSDGEGVSVEDTDCLVPMLETDITKTFFDFDWDVTFSTHIHLRGFFAEMVEATRPLQGEPQNFTDNGQEIRVRFDVAEEALYTLSSFAFGDREHPKSRPQLAVMHLLLQLLSEVTLWLLTLLYWYTRTTDQGLSMKAQSMEALSRIVDILALANVQSKADWVSFSTVLRILSYSYSAAVALLIFATLTRIDLTSSWQLIRRRPSKGERDTRRVDARISWLVPVSVFVLFFTFVRYVVPKEYNLIGSQTCRSEGPAITEVHTRFVNEQIFKQIVPALINTSAIVQILHNFRSQAYAGNFKIYTILGAAIYAVDMVVKRIEWVSGWVANREPIDLASFVYFLVAAVFATQAIIYPGIPQTIGEEEDAE